MLVAYWGYGMVLFPILVILTDRARTVYGSPKDTTKVKDKPQDQERTPVDHFEIGVPRRKRDSRGHRVVNPPRDGLSSPSTNPELHSTTPSLRHGRTFLIPHGTDPGSSSTDSEGSSNSYPTESPRWDQYYTLPYGSQIYPPNVPPPLSIIPERRSASGSASDNSQIVHDSPRDFDSSSPRIDQTHYGEHRPVAPAQNSIENPVIIPPNDGAHRGRTWDSVTTIRDDQYAPDRVV